VAGRRAEGASACGCVFVFVPAVGGGSCNLQMEGQGWGVHLSTGNALDYVHQLKTEERSALNATLT